MLAEDEPPAKTKEKEYLLWLFLFFPEDWWRHD